MSAATKEYTFYVDMKLSINGPWVQMWEYKGPYNYHIYINHEFHLDYDRWQRVNKNRVCHDYRVRSVESPKLGMVGV